MVPCHLVTELVALSEYLPWYELNELRIVSKEWNEILSEALPRNSCWQRIIDYLNQNNSLHLCSACHRPWLADGTNTDLCDGKLCARGYGGHAQTEVALEICKRLEVLPFPDARVCVGFMQLPTHQRAKFMFDYHVMAVRHIQGGYIENFVQHRVFHDLHLRRLGDLASFDLERLYIRQRPAFDLMSTVGSLLVAKSDLASCPWTVCQKMAGEDPDDEHFQAVLDALYGGEVLDDLYSLDLYMEEILDNQSCQCLELLFGPKLIKCIDMFAGVKKILALNRHHIFPPGWEIELRRDDDDDDHDDDDDDDEDSDSWPELNRDFLREWHRRYGGVYTSEDDYDSRDDDDEESSNNGDPIKAHINDIGSQEDGSSCGFSRIGDESVGLQISDVGSGVSDKDAGGDPNIPQPVVALPCNLRQRSKEHGESQDSQDSDEADSDSEARLVVPQISDVDSQSNENGHCDPNDRLSHGEESNTSAQDDSLNAIRLSLAMASLKTSLNDAT
jgi:hypothetical protein